MVRWPLGPVAAVLALAATPAHADEAKGAALVALVTAEPEAPLTRRVSAELKGLGLDVIVLRPPAEASPTRQPLEQAARNVGAIAALRLVLSGAGKIEVWVADRVTGKAVVRELDVPRGASGDSSTAVEAVELLRASLMELHATDTPHGEVAPTPAIEAIALPARPPPWKPRAGLGFALGPDLGLRGLGSTLEGQVALWTRLAGPVGLRFLGAASLSPAHATTSAGAVDVSSQLAAVLASYDLADVGGAWVPTVSLGVGAAHVAAAGTATAPYVSASDGAWYCTALAEAGLAWSLARGLRLRLGVLGGWVVPAAEVHTPTAVAGSWGGPLLAMTVGMDVLWAP